MLFPNIRKQLIQLCGEFPRSGGGLKMGQVIGRSDRTGSAPATTPISSGNVLATVMHTLFNLGEVRILPGIPTDVERTITGNQPIQQLV